MAGGRCALEAGMWHGEGRREKYSPHWRTQTSQNETLESSEYERKGKREVWKSEREREREGVWKRRRGDGWTTSREHDMTWEFHSVWTWNLPVNFCWEFCREALWEKSIFVHMCVCMWTGVKFIQNSCSLKCMTVKSIYWRERIYLET